MSDETTPTNSPTKLPFKVVDHTRQKKFGLVASSLKELTEKACEKLEVEYNHCVTLVLDMDGTIIDDEEYFSTLECNTVLMLLTLNQRWTIQEEPRCSVTLDETDGSRSSLALKLVDRLRSDISYITLLSMKELELLADMDPNSLGDFDRTFVETLQGAIVLFLDEYQDAKDAIDLLNLYIASKTQQENV